MELNAVQLQSVLKLLDKLDKLTMNMGTHLEGQAMFTVYDENANQSMVTVEWSQAGGCHYLVGKG